MVRAGMGRLIQTVRRLAGDPSGVGQTFGDDDYQDALDMNRTWHPYLQLTAESDPATNLYRRFTGGDNWEDPVLLNSSWGPINAADYVADGPSFTFTTGRSDPVVYAQGYTYDPFAAAATILDWMLVRAKDDYDVTIGGDSFSRSQKREAIQALRDQMVTASGAGSNLRTIRNFRSDQTKGRASGWG
jgi:hypothetical protein